MSSDYIAIEGQRNVNRRTTSQQIPNEKLSIWSLVVEHEATACVAVFLPSFATTDKNELGNRFDMTYKAAYEKSENSTSQEDAIGMHKM